MGGDGSLTFDITGPMLVRILIWGLFDSKTSIRSFGTLFKGSSRRALGSGITRARGSVSSCSATSSPEAIGHARELIGRDPDVVEEFDELEL